MKTLSFLVVFLSWLCTGKLLQHTCFKTLKSKVSLTNRDEERQRQSILFVPQSLILMIDLGLPSPLSWRTMTAGTVTFHLWTLHRTSLYQLNVRKSMWPDGIHPRALKELVDVTAEPFSIIRQRSWESGEVSADLKLASVIPIYSKGVKKGIENNRPVSLTSVLGKIMEEVILAFKGQCNPQAQSAWAHKGKVLLN